MEKKLNSGPSPYLSGRREWEERYGDHVSSARNWRLVAFISLIIALIATGGAIYLAGKKEVVPYIVEVDRTGEIQQIQQATTTNNAIQEKMILASLARFVSKVRNVVLDAQMQRQNVLEAYVYLRKNTPAFTKITEFFQGNDPFIRAQRETVFIKIIRIMPLKDKAYQIEWKETIMDRKTGETTQEEKFKIVAFVTLSPPQSEEAILKNPIGLIINDLNWSKEI